MGDGDGDGAGEGEGEDEGEVLLLESQARRMAKQIVKKAGTHPHPPSASLTSNRKGEQITTPI